MEKKITPEQAAKVEEGMDLWRGKDEPVKPESKTAEHQLTREEVVNLVVEFSKNPVTKYVAEMTVVKYSDQQLAAFKSSIDKEYLQWLYLRLITMHGENSDYDYMIKFKNLIDQL